VRANTDGVQSYEVDERRFHSFESSDLVSISVTKGNNRRSNCAMTSEASDLGLRFSVQAL
jgi:hypothetical protein